ncbi:MAG TPA: glucosamine-6-phosphate deaminase [Chitinophagaceae bacterium]|nr:glucosamine-6-phosphate deaminase [Chitinophagaceae bacterium]
MECRIFDEYNGLSDAAAELIIQIVERKPEAVLCFATGNSPVGTYRALAIKAKERSIDFSQCFCFGLDEWLGVPPEKKGSCHNLLYEQVFHPLGIHESQVHLFDGMTKDVDMECRIMNGEIEHAGGIDCMLVGIGLNGHIGFNEPGVDMELRAHEQELHGSTLASGQLYFNEPTAIAKGITLGMAQVMNARTLLLLANGNSKSDIIHKACDGPVTNEVPASFIQKHRHAVLMIDREAASKLNK